LKGGLLSELNHTPSGEIHWEFIFIKGELQMSERMGDMIFYYDGYTYWFSVIDTCYYKEKLGSLEKIEITRDEFYAADEARWDQYK
jgi:hypothetical protein